MQRTPPSRKDDVSTRSRPKAAGPNGAIIGKRKYKFQHAAARRRLGKTAKYQNLLIDVSTRSRPKAAGGGLALWVLPSGKFQHAAARRRLVTLSITKIILKKFQHAAARRRLV